MKHIYYNQVPVIANDNVYIEIAVPENCRDIDYVLDFKDSGDFNLNFQNLELYNYINVYHSTYATSSVINQLIQSASATYSMARSITGINRNINTKRIYFWCRGNTTLDGILRIKIIFDVEEINVI
jgi:hypothetical protein